MKNDETSAGNADVRVGSSENADGDVGVPGGGVPGTPKEWYSRGYLPHRDSVGLLQSITFRLADSLPQQMLHGIEAELVHLSEDRRDAQRRRKIEERLDRGMGCCALGHPLVAQAVQDSLLHFDGDRYCVVAWCIMPNHVHVLVEPRQPIAQIVQGWKSFTARWTLPRNEELKLAIPNSRHLWMREYWDRYIRHERHLIDVIDYFHNNPVKAGLCRRPQDWRWSSAGNALPGNADVPVGILKRADGDVGVPRKAD